ncbi:hypothetical protein [Pelotalea chapellei]|uniref:Metallothionein n=1 Tax=Pelotalea chapellei TaxID=44671 RepID=A0ABS5U7U8_9BACT|nr:hypothetical protein [Pelotalea chapellei]MBT1071748.1 hypothetical protein [Pelotalea chapellei]
MEKNIQCSCQGNHHAHMCMLKSSGNREEIEKITSDPKFYCFTCAAEANCAENLCAPAPIQ